MQWVRPVYRVYRYQYCMPGATDYVLSDGNDMNRTVYEQDYRYIGTFQLSRWVEARALSCNTHCCCCIFILLKFPLLVWIFIFIIIIIAFESTIHPIESCPCSSTIPTPYQLYQSIPLRWEMLLLYLLLYYLFLLILLLVLPVQVSATAVDDDDDDDDDKTMVIPLYLSLLSQLPLL